ncbi:unnamed protein product [Malus baccata var. baccata]
MEKSTTAAILLLLYFFEFCPQPGVSSFANPSDDLGGTAGCPLVTTLSANYSVLLLERGNIPSAYPNVLRQNETLANFMQEDGGKTLVQRFTSEDGVANVRGRILGWSSMINIGIYSRADSEFYDKSGIKLDMNLVNNSYEWVENTVIFRPNVTHWQSVVKDAMLEAGVRPDNGLTLDHILGSKVTGTLLDNRGKRHGAVEHLNKGHPKNLSCNSCHSLSAKGIIYSDSNGRSHRALIRGKGEVILSAGAIGSPQLLLLSGVGPKSYLSSRKIPVVHPQPYVGQFMRDNLVITLPLWPRFNDYYIETFSGLPFSTQAFSLFPSPTIPMTINSSFGHIIVKFPGPLSYGSLKLQSSYDVKVAPNVKFNYFAQEADISRCVNTVATFWHYHDGCVVGKVVDEDLRVMGIKALRVVDGSVFNLSPGTNPQATLMMLGRIYSMLAFKCWKKDQSDTFLRDYIKFVMEWIEDYSTTFSVMNIREYVPYCALSNKYT